MPIEKIPAIAHNHIQECQRLRYAFQVKAWPRQAVWRPPNPSTLKTNFVCAMFEDLNEASIEVVVRNSKDSEIKIMVALCGKFPMTSSMVLLETIAARRAVHFTHEIGIPSSIFDFYQLSSHKNLIKDIVFG